MDYMDDGFESDEENFYNDDEDTEPCYGFVEEDIKQSEKSYVVLKEEDIHKHQREDIERVSMVLSLSQVEAIVLLLHFQWSVSKVEDEWFTDEERIRKNVGLLKQPVVDVNGRDVHILCGICFDSYTLGEIARVSCGHPYCITCWTGYVSTKINDGPECLRFKCPEPSCSAAVDQDLIDKVSNEEDKEKYYRYFLRSYVEENKNKIKWCPSPGCEYAIECGVESGSKSSNYDVSCLCSNKFCWNCCEDAHSPVDCETVSKWIFRNQDESENKNWILVNSKACPKCKRPIEKNDGCNHMTCQAPCKHSFCWVCLKPSKNHSACNKFVDKDEQKQKKVEEAKLAIDKYMHYYVRWGNNQSSKLKAMKDLEALQSVHLKKLCTELGTSEAQLQFTIDAWVQIIECRRVLKWTYAYGYYLPTDSHQEQVKKQLFEYLQGEAESGLERLHYCAETELQQFICKTEDSFNDFCSFQTKLINLTKVTKTYFENLVEALENGLEDERYNDNISVPKSSRGKKRKARS